MDLFVDEDSKYANQLTWRLYPIKLTVGYCTEDGLVVYISRYQRQLLSRKRLYMHVPKKPLHKLSSEYSDGLAHAVLIPRMFRPLRRSAMYTSFTMQIQYCSYTGYDSMDITHSKGFMHPSVLQDYECCLAIQGRNDINALVTKHVNDGNMLASLAEGLRY